MKLSKAGLERLHQLIAGRVAAGEADIAELAQAATEQRLARGAMLLRAGEQARLAGIVVEGLLGEFYELADGRRKAKWLARPGEVFGSLEDLVREGPARTTIEALQDSLVVCVPYARLRALALQRPLWSAFYVSMIEDLYRGKSEREYSLLMLKAEQRYAWFLQHFGDLASQLPQEIVASYLGITPVHLSRVRGSSRRAS